MSTCALSNSNYGLDLILSSFYLVAIVDALLYVMWKFALFYDSGLWSLLLGVGCWVSNC